MEIHIPVSHFQKNNMSQTTFPAVSVGEKLMKVLSKKKDIPMFF